MPADCWLRVRLEQAQPEPPEEAWQERAWPAGGQRGPAWRVRAWPGDGRREPAWLVRAQVQVQPAEALSA
ncbi:MAG TPA: hypothetical protein VGO11_00275 [Chthoniobacteraceae bacterium]|nr:hypothetical protein [Chthoniobacteraceae bacterium]